MKGKILNLFIVLIVISFQIIMPITALGQLTIKHSEEYGLVPSKCADGINCQWEQFEELINNVLNFIIKLATLFSALAIAYAGFLYLSAAGDEKKIGEAHSIFKKVVLGLIWTLAAYLIVKTILSVLATPDLKI